MRQGILWLLVLVASLGLAQQSRPASDPQVVEAARKEGKLVIYSSTDQSSAQALLDDFRKLYPFIQIEYNDLGTQAIYDRFVSETAAGAQSADLLWSSAMELQVKLASEGYALPYDSPEAKNWPANARLENLAYGTTLEPAVVVYNKRFLKPEEVPTTREGLVRLLQEPRMRGRVATWDPERSAAGFTILKADYDRFPAFQNLVRAFGRAQAALYSSTGAAFEKVISGEHYLAYGFLGSYALLRQRTVKDLGIAYLTDGTVAIQRVAFINKRAAHPNAAKLFLDYLLSLRGQNLMAYTALIFARRETVVGEATPQALYKAAGGKEKVYAIPVSTEILKNLDPAERMRFLTFWRQAIRGQ
ncbi:ABC transporter substrate-binding protein [Thermus thermophilus]|uniref:ABC transporter substrate-binding protein n=1 Tax=Thermus thermophilus TaxID=274 RepID=UPI001FCCB153|nr:ABC transporter substrate-binding protein [Thermus thermophilus]BDG29832.1 iron ABC transporter substrate-binding protein [Thermus thermophilus]